MQTTSTFTIKPTVKPWGDDDGGDGNSVQEVDLFSLDPALANMYKNQYEDVKEDDDEDSSDNTGSTDDDTQEQDTDDKDNDDSEKSNDDDDSDDSEQDKGMSKEEIDKAWEKKVKEYEKKGIKDKDVLNELKSNFHSQHKIGKQRQRIGDLKKELETSEAKRKELEKDFKPLTDEEYDRIADEKGLSAANKAKQESDERKSLLNEEQQKEILLRNKIAINEKVDDYLDLVPDMAALIAEDDGASDFVEIFKQNPYQLNPALAINLARSARLNKQVANLAKENEKLQRQLDDMPKNVVNRMRNIGKNANERKKGSAGAGGSKGKGLYDAASIGLMSMDEIKEN